MPFQVKELVLSFEPKEGEIGYNVGLKVKGYEEAVTEAVFIEAKIDCGRTPAPVHESVPVNDIDELKRVLQKVVDQVHHG